MAKCSKHVVIMENEIDWRQLLWSKENLGCRRGNATQ